MIKRYILHIEAHRNVFRYRPRISFKRAPRHGDRVVDGGVPGTLKLCPTCQEGFLHQADPATPPKRATRRRPSKPPLLGLLAEDLVRNLARQSVTPPRPTGPSYHRPRPAMDLSVPTHVELKVTEPKAEKKVKKDKKAKVESPKHVELKQEKDPILQLEFEDGSPETLKLDYTLGRFDYETGDIVWTHKAEYVVEKLEDDILYLVRKDVWDKRKEGSHVELNFDKPAEHVELTSEEEKPGTVVELKFE